MSQKKDKEKLIRDLAFQVSEAAGSAENRERRRLWIDSNDLKGAERTPVFCELYDTWQEVVPESTLMFEEAPYREVEYDLKKTLYKYSLGDDSVIEPYVEVMADTNLGQARGVFLWGAPISRIKSNDGGWIYTDFPVKSERDLEKITFPDLRYDRENTEQRRRQVEDLLGDILPVKITLGAASRQWAKLHSWASALCGMENLFIWMMDNPGILHAVMQKMQRGILRLMDQCEEAGILVPNNTGRMSCRSLPQPDFDGSHVRFKDIWGRGESQEFDVISPGMYYEFLLQYQMPILTRFGIINYGCCENLTHKIDLVKQIPNLRQFICSPWSDFREFIRILEDRYVIEWRQKATDIIFADDLGDIQKKLAEDLRAARGCHVQIMLDSVMTLGKHPSRLKDWVKSALEISAQN